MNQRQLPANGSAHLWGYKRQNTSFAVRSNEKEKPHPFSQGAHLLPCGPFSSSKVAVAGLPVFLAYSSRCTADNACTLEAGVASLTRAAPASPPAPARSEEEPYQLPVELG